MTSRYRIPSRAGRIATVVLVVLAMVAFYGVIAHLVWAPPGFVPVDNGTALPYAAEVPGIHSANVTNITVDGPAGQRTITVEGRSPAEELELYYYNESGKVGHTTITREPRLGQFTITKPMTSDSATRVTVVYEGWFYPRVISNHTISATSNGTRTPTSTSPAPG